MVDYAWTGTAGDHSFGTAGNWSPTGVPDPSSTISIPFGSAINLTGNTTLEGITGSGGTGTITLAGPAPGSPPYILELTSTNITANPGNVFNIPNVILKDDHGFTLLGTGNYTLQGGAIISNTAVTIDTGQNVILNQANYTSLSGVTGAGTITLDNGQFTSNVAPTVGFAFADITSGSNHLNIPSYTGFGPTISSITNIGYGTSINAGGDNLALTSNGNGTYSLKDTNDGHTICPNVTLHDGLTPADFNMSGGNFVANPDVPVPCFCTGTRILTDRGEVAVEDLKVGDLVMTASGDAQPIRWLGRTVVDCASAIRPAPLWPVCIVKGAFDEMTPHRDLWVSSGHSIACDDALIPVSALINGRTIFQSPRKTVEYWHVELGRHSVLLAEGLPAESYLDTGNRAMFADGAEFRASRPDIESKHWSDTCLPFASEGPAVVKAKATLIARAEALGYRRTTAPNLHIIADGQRFDPELVQDRTYLFELPRGRRSITLHSRNFRPAEIIAGSGDVRTLGVSIQDLQLDGRDIALDSDLGVGWQPLERDKQQRMWRWTTGATPLETGVRLVRVKLRHSGIYWDEIEAAEAKVA